MTDTTLISEVAKTDPTILAELAKAVPVVVGGLLAVAGGFASQFLVHRLLESRERSKLRREKLEALVRALYLYGQWIEEKRLRMVFRNEDHDTPSPLDEARMIQSLHFPELTLELSAVQKAGLPMLQFIGEQRLKHMANKKEFIEQWDPEPFNAAYQEHLAAVGAVVKKCRALMAK